MGIKVIGLSKEETIQNARKNILPRYNGNDIGGRVATLVMTVHNRTKISYGIQFLKDPKPGTYEYVHGKRVEVIQEVKKEG